MARPVSGRAGAEQAKLAAAKAAVSPVVLPTLPILPARGPGWRQPTKQKPNNQVQVPIESV